MKTQEGLSLHDSESASIIFIKGKKKKDHLYSATEISFPFLERCVLPSYFGRLGRCSSTVVAWNPRHQVETPFSPSLFFAWAILESQNVCLVLDDWSDVGRRGSPGGDSTHRRLLTAPFESYRAIILPLCLTACSGLKAANKVLQLNRPWQLSSWAKNQGRISISNSL